MFGILMFWFDFRYYGCLYLNNFVETPDESLFKQFPFQTHT